MSLVSKLKYIIFVATVIPTLLYAQEYSNKISVIDTFSINLENQYFLSATNLIANSEEVILAGRNLTKPEYSLNIEEMMLSLSPELEYSIEDTLIIKYESFDLGLQKNYQRRELVRKVDVETKDTISVARRVKTDLSTSSIFGKEMNQSGSLIRGFTVGTTKDFSLNSGLRLQLSGKLTNNIDIVAALTDENTPIQPEGNTESLEELDKVFIEVKHPNAVGTFGDYDLVKNEGEFGKVNRKLQGLKAQAFVKNQYGQAAIAGSRGKFTTNNFSGIEGVQGPYRLTGRNNERSIIVIAGSEQVYIDGQRLKRGEANDYIIDYANAELTFTPQRLITSASRIYVDFEYTDRQFQRNFMGANYSGKFLDENLTVKFDYYREGDDPNNPIDVDLSDDDLEILRNAGDDRTLAGISGVTLAQPDSNGLVRGTYTKADTIINGQASSYYIYAPGDSSSIYNVRFSYVGEGKGDYSKISLGNYRFVGANRGAYLPIRFLPLSQLAQLGNLAIESKIVEGVNLNLELAGSSLDQNRLSSIDDNNNTGYARNIKLLVEPREIKFAGLEFGKAGFSFKDRYIENRFNSLDRINEVEFQRYYNLPENSFGNETLREFELDLLPVSDLSIHSMYGLIKKGNSFSSNRYLTKVNYSAKDFFTGYYNLDYVESDNSLIKTNWLRQDANLNIIYKKLNPGVEFLYENKKDKLKSRDSLSSSSLRYMEASPFLRIADIYGLSATGKLSFRSEYFPLNGEMVKQSDAFTRSLDLNYRGIRQVNSTLSLVFRNKKITEPFRLQGLSDNETILIRSQTRTNFFDNFINGDLFYETATLRTAKLERVFIRVPVGTGNFIYLGDLNENGIADEEEYQPAIYDADYIQLTVPTDELFPVIDLKLNTRLTFDFSKIFKGDNFASKILNPISTETMFRVEENSREKNTEKIYLLDFSKFLNDSTTIRGFNFFQHDFHLYKNQSDFSLRFRFTQRKSLNQFSAGLEKSYFREKSFRLKFRFADEIGNQTEYINQTDNLAAPSNFNRSRIATNNEITSDFSYRPERNIEVGFKFRVGRNEDVLPETPTVIDLNSEIIRFNFSIANKGRLRIELERTELIANTNDNVIPFEILKGNLLGKNYFGRLNFDYRVAGNLQTTVAYDARIQGSNRTVHTLRAEARAFF